MVRMSKLANINTRFFIKFFRLNAQNLNLNRPKIKATNQRFLPSSKRGQQSPLPSLALRTSSDECGRNRNA
jgi:hypothetical protein